MIDRMQQLTARSRTTGLQPDAVAISTEEYQRRQPAAWKAARDGIRGEQ